MTEVWLLYTYQNHLVGIFSTEDNALEHAMEGDIVSCAIVDKISMLQQDQISYVVTE